MREVYILLNTNKKKTNASAVISYKRPLWQREKTLLEIKKVMDKSLCSSSRNSAICVHWILVYMHKKMKDFSETTSKHDIENTVVGRIVWCSLRFSFLTLSVRSLSNSQDCGYDGISLMWLNYDMWPGWLSDCSRWIWSKQASL
jgi:hypothetical protein